MSTKPDVPTILWGSFLTSHALIAGVAFVAPPDPVPDPSWIPLFGLPAVLAAGVSVQGGVLARAVPQLQTWYILRFALAEAASILGLVSFLLSGEHLVQAACAAVGVVAHLLAFPTARSAELYADARR